MARQDAIIAKLEMLKTRVEAMSSSHTSTQDSLSSTSPALASGTGVKPKGVSLPSVSKSINAN